MSPLVFAMEDALSEEGRFCGGTVAINIYGVLFVSSVLSRVLLECGHFSFSSWAGSIAPAPRPPADTPWDRWPLAPRLRGLASGLFSCPPECLLPSLDPGR